MTDPTPSAQRDGQQDAPERACVLAIKIGGDTPKDVIGLLRHFIWEIEAGGLRNITSGGYGSGGAMVYAENEGVTHDSYFEEVDKWIAQRRNEEDRND